MPAPSTCLVDAAQVAVVLNKHWESLCCLSWDNTQEINLKFAKDFLVELAGLTVKLNPTVVGNAVLRSKIVQKTSKPVGKILNELWQHITKKNHNRKSSNLENMGAVEALVAGQWQKLSSVVVKKEEPQPDAKAGHLVGLWEIQSQPCKLEPKAEVKTEANVVKTEALAPEQPKGEPQVQPDKPAAAPFLVSSNRLLGTGLVYFPADGTSKDLPMQLGEAGFGVVRVGEHTLQTLVPNTSLKGVLSHPGASSSGLAGEDVPDDDAGHQAQAEAELHAAGQQTQSEAELHDDGQPAQSEAELHGAEPDHPQEEQHEEQDAQMEDAPAESAQEVLVSDTDSDVIMQFDQPGPMACRTPATWAMRTPATMSPEVGMHDAMPHMDEEDDPEDLIPLANLGHHLRLMEMVHSLCRQRPQYRLRRKVPATRVAWVLVYKARPKPVHTKYSVMYYRANHSIAVRQKHGKKMQLGNCVLPSTWSSEKGRVVAWKVISDTLQKDSSWEPYTGQLLYQLKDAMLEGLAVGWGCMLS